MLELTPDASQERVRRSKEWLEKFLNLAPKLGDVGKPGATWDEVFGSPTRTGNFNRNVGRFLLDYALFNTEKPAGPTDSLGWGESWMGFTQEYDTDAIFEGEVPVASEATGGVPVKLQQAYGELAIEGFSADLVDFAEYALATDVGFGDDGGGGFYDDGGGASGGAGGEE